MQKIAILFLLVATGFGKAAMSQDTLRLFGHKKNQSAEKQVYYESSSPATEIHTLTGSGRSTGFYLGFHSDYSQVAGYDAIGVGGSLAMIANHGLAIGLTGKGFISEPYTMLLGSNTSYSYTGGYGGLLIEPVLFPRSPVHVAFPIVLGGGGIARSILTNYNYPYDHTGMYVEDAEAYLIAEPGVELEFNIARWMRLAIGGSYRFTTAIEQTTFETNPMEGFTAGFSLKFGKF